MRTLRVLLKVGGAALFLTVGLVVGEVLLARRVEPIEPFVTSDATSGAGDPVSVAWIGDSTTAGVGASSQASAVPALVAEQLRGLVTTRVLSVSGATTADALRDQLPLLRSSDWVFVAIGNNDVTHVTTRAKFRRDFSELIDKVDSTSPGRLVILGIAEFGGTPLFAQPLRAMAGFRAHQLDQIVRQVARSRGATYVPIADLTRAGFAADPAKTHASDRFHPSDAGYRLWAKAVIDTLRL